MKTLLLIILLLCGMASLAQNFPSSELIPEDEQKLGLSDFRNSSASFSFRFWNQGQAIDIQIKADSVKIGVVTNFLREASRSNKTQRKFAEGKLKPKVYVQKIELSKEKIEKIIAIIEKYKIYDLPSDDSIKSWQPVLDGEWFSIEQNIHGKYSLKTYGNPDSQINLPEATIFLNFYSDLNKALNLNDLFWTFFQRLKIQCCMRNGEHEIICKKKS